MRAPVHTDANSTEYIIEHGIAAMESGGWLRRLRAAVANRAPVNLSAQGLTPQALESLNWTWSSSGRREEKPSCRISLTQSTSTDRYAAT